MTSEPLPPNLLLPPLKWAGGKRWQVPHLLPLWKAHDWRLLVEPFCGGLAVSLGLQPNMALLNDVNQHLVNFYRWLKRGLVIEFSMANDETRFYECRTRFNALIASGHTDTAEAAGLFYYLNRTCFNGLCRFNSKGIFNVPFGKYKTINYRSDFFEYRQAFSGWNFLNVDFEKMPIDPNDFIYADPPYDVEFTTYSMGGFNWGDQVRTAKWLAKHPGPVVLSNQATPRILELYRSLGFACALLDAPRRISCTGDRSPAREVFATRNISASGSLLEHTA